MSIVQSTASMVESIENLTNGIQQGAQSAAAGSTAAGSAAAGLPGGAVLRSSETARQKYIDQISTYRNRLTDARNKAATLAHYGNVGKFGSAQQVKSVLTNDVTAPGSGFLAIIDQYISYLDEFEHAVNATFTKMHAEDMSGAG